MTSKQWFNLHTHSKFSVLDAMPEVSEMVATIHRNNQPALGLTDHGLMSGNLQLYRECKKVGVAPFPGIEFYIVRDVEDKSAKRYHIGMLALSPTPGTRRSSNFLLSRSVVIAITTSPGLT